MQSNFSPALVFRTVCSFCCLVVLLSSAAQAEQTAEATQLLAGAAKIDVTDYDAGPVNDPMFVRVVAIKSGGKIALLIGVDAVAIGEIGPIGNDYLPTVRKTLDQELGIPASQVIVNASHCHGLVRKDLAAKTVEAVRQALDKLEPVKAGAGTGHEDRIMENRRLRLKSGREVDVRHAYSLPRDEEVVGAGPIDPEIGILRLDRMDGSTLAVIYNFACHPILGVPSGGNTADMTGFSSKVIENNLSQGAVALFLQGCGGDINPASYKDFEHPRDAEILGNQLGLSVLEAVRKISCTDTDRFQVINETLTLPRGDRTERIAQLEAEQRRLLQQLQGTTLNFKTFVPLMIKYDLSDNFPADPSFRYLHQEALGREDLKKLDSVNRKNLEAYRNNIFIMEELTRLQANLALLKKHQASLVASGKRTIDVEIAGVRIGDFVLVTFPGELTSQIGLNIKKQSPHDLTFVAGYTNGYIYYAPTAEQMMNVGGAQEDSDCILAPEWQEQFEEKVAEMLKGL
ncbi:hypothetical protein SH661x_001571 [Planctomicrobium sp. SH661]|uniref:hypothetical protein n=1 Tax=Planctomicrobium sp. SH661 TaxID=3448124 RepID=UPI003F5C9441